MSQELLIASRVALLRRGLSSVQGVSNDLDESRGPLMLQLDIAQDSELVALVLGVNGLGTQFTTFAAKVKAMAPDTSREIRDLARKLEDDTDLILTRLNTLMRERTQPLKLRAIPKEDLARGMNGSPLGSQASALDNELEGVAGRVEAAVKLKANGDEPGAAREFAIAWQALGEAARKSAVVFGEYVDFLGGLALRETGFDRGLCRIADRFVKEWEDDQKWPWASWTVPAHEEAREVTMARILRLGFPEWSFWALPLAAHEFANVALAWPHLGQVAQAHSGVRDVKTLVADIFATYVAGPAYASALFILRLSPPIPGMDERESAPVLNPAPVANPPPVANPASMPDTDSARAYVTLRTLEALDSPEAGSTPTAYVRTELAAYWDGALAQVPPQPALGAARLAELDVLVTDTIARIKVFKFPIHRWPDVEKWADKLRAKEEVKPDREDEVRMALNAAWLARLNSRADRQADLVAAGRKLAERIMSPTEPAQPDQTGRSATDKTTGAGVLVR